MNNFKEFNDYQKLDWISMDEIRDRLASLEIID